jgi:putative transposase
LRESDRLLQGRILSATVRYQRARWLVWFTVETTGEMLRPAAIDQDAVVGLDLGIKVLAVLSTGQVVDNPKPLTRAHKHLRRLSRRVSRRVGPDRRTRQEPSRRWEPAAADLAKTHATVADNRTDSQHKLTTALTARYDTVVVEDLNVAGMVKNRRLARVDQRCRVRTDPPADRVQDLLAPWPGDRRGPLIRLQ